MLALVAVFVIVGCGDLDGSIFEEGAVKTHLGITDGLSAYEIAVDNGYVGTEAEWLDSLRGDAGVQGVSGLDGVSAYQLWILAGNEGTEADFIVSLQGVDGVCPDCNIEPPVIIDPIPVGIVRVTFQTSMEGLTDFKVGHLLGMGLVSIYDIEGNGTTLLTADINITEGGSHMVGYQFTK